MNFEDFLTDYNLDFIDVTQFVINILLAAMLSLIVSLFYKKFGRSVSNRTEFSNNFVLLALTTMLIITIVKSSIALSLGLVGALSIVRFRAAIKEPEELTYLFLVIGIGLGMGANQTVITILAVILILAILYLQGNLKKVKSTINNQMVVNISSTVLNETEINEILKSQFKVIELRRFSHEEGQLYLTYVIVADNFSNLSSVKNSLLEKDQSVSFSFIENKNMIG